MKWNLRTKKPANDEAPTGTRSTLRRRAAVAAGIVALSTAAGAVPAFGIFTPDRTPTYGGSYVLWYGNQYAGAIRNFSGCAQAVEVNAGGNPPLAGKPQVTPCIFDVGLNTSDTFKRALTDALSGRPAITDVAIGVLNGAGTTSVSELRFRGYISDVTLPGLSTASTSDPRFITVELRNASRISTVAPGRAVPAKGTSVDPVEAAKPFIRLDDGESLDGAAAAVRPLAFVREDGGGDVDMETATHTPGALAMPQPELGVQDPNAIANFGKWIDNLMEMRLGTYGCVSNCMLTIRYTSVSGAYTLELASSVLPHYFDRFSRTDGRRVLGVAHAQVKVTWATQAVR